MPTAPYVPTAQVLRRVAACVAGIQTGDQVYVAVDTDETRRPWNIEFYATLAEAEDYVSTHTGYKALGPYQTVKTADANAAAVGDALFVFPKPFPTRTLTPTSIVARLSDVEKVTISVTLKPNVTPLGPTSVDLMEPEAVFFTLSGFDRFLAPYLAQLYDPLVASHVRTTLTDLIALSLD